MLGTALNTHAWAILSFVVIIVAHAGLTDSRDPSPRALHIEFPLEGGSFAEDEPPHVIVSASGDAWPSETKVTMLIEGDEVKQYFEYEMRETFEEAVQPFESGGSMMATFTLHALPCGKYSLKISADNRSENDQQTWNEIPARRCVFFVCIVAEGDGGEEGEGQQEMQQCEVDGSCTDSRASELDDGVGPVVFFDFPPNGHLFDDEPPSVAFRIERFYEVFERGSHGQVFLNGHHSADVTSPKGSISLLNVKFEDGVPYTLSIALIASLGAGQTRKVAENRTIFFASSHEISEVSTCMADPSACVSYLDLEAEEAIGEDDDRTKAAEEGLQRMVTTEWLMRREAGATSMHASSNSIRDSLPDFSNFLREEGGELIMADFAGPGCIQRMFFPVVEGPNDSGPAWRLRVRLDGDLVVDLPLSQLAELGTPPFIHPIAGFGHAQLGFLSLVPFPFRRRAIVSFKVVPDQDAKEILRDCRQCLEEEQICNTKVYWDIDARRNAALAPPITSQVGSKLVASQLGSKPSTSLSPTPTPRFVQVVRELATRKGKQDPTSHGSEPSDDDVQVLEVESEVVPGQKTRVWEWTGHHGGCVTSWTVMGARGTGDLRALWVEITFDGADEAQVLAPLQSLFLWTPRSLEVPGHEAQSMLLGHDDTGVGYSSFPMPFASSVQISLWNSESEPSSPSKSVSLSISLSTTNRFRKKEFAYFHVFHRPLAQVTRGQEYELLDVQGRWGKLVGVIQEIESERGARGDGFYEGDFKLFVDDARTERVHESGTEDYFNAAHGYVSMFNFSQPLFGAPFIKPPARLQDEDGDGHIWHIYRLLMGDAVLFQWRLRVLLEHGSVQNSIFSYESNTAEGRYGSTVLFYAGAPGSGVGKVLDKLQVADPESASRHDYQIRVLEADKGGVSHVWTDVIHKLEDCTFGGQFRYAMPEGHGMNAMSGEARVGKTVWGGRFCVDVGKFKVQSGGHVVGKEAGDLLEGVELQFALRRGAEEEEEDGKCDEGEGKASRQTAGGGGVWMEEVEGPIAIEFWLLLPPQSLKSDAILRRTFSFAFQLFARTAAGPSSHCTCKVKRSDQCARLYINDAPAGLWLSAGSNSEAASTIREEDFLIAHPLLPSDAPARAPRRTKVRIVPAVCVGGHRAFWTEASYVLLQASEASADPT